MQARKKIGETNDDERTSTFYMHYTPTGTHTNAELAHMIGSPTRLSAQCRTVKASCNRSGLTPTAPLNSLIIRTCNEMASSTILERDER